MADVKDGGPVFPVQDVSKQQCCGISKRFYAACAAMQALAGTLPKEDISSMAAGILGGKRIAEAAFVLADALIDEEGKS